MSELLNIIRQEDHQISGRQNQGAFTGRQDEKTTTNWKSRLRREKKLYFSQINFHLD